MGCSCCICLIRVDVLSVIMVGRMLSLLKKRMGEAKRRTIVVGLKSDYLSRDMLLSLLNSVVSRGDNLLAVHVQDTNDAFDPNTFHIYEDLCKSKQVDFQVKICIGSCYITELSHQVRINFGTILALGCSSDRPRGSTFSRCLKVLPPTCTLLIMDNRGLVLIRMQGTSQQGAASEVLQSSQSALSNNSTSDKFDTPQIRKSLTMPSTTTSSFQPSEISNLHSEKTMQHPNFVAAKVFEKLATLDLKGSGRRFTLKELKQATNDFSPESVIGEGGHSMVYRANLENGEAVAVKVFKSTASGVDVLVEAEILSGLKHENIVGLLGYCYTKEVRAVVYNLLRGSLKQALKHLQWKERVGVAIGIAKALDYLHSCSPPIVHRDVKSSNILLADDYQPQLSDFGAAMAHQQNLKGPTYVKPNLISGTIGYMSPEYMMYGKVDEKIDVYSYGVVLLELITGRGAIQTTNSSKRESLVLWARSLLCSGLCERLIDPNLNEDYDRDEMKLMMIAARLCLLHSSSRRPTMKTVLRLFEEPEYWLGMHRRREELLNGIHSSSE